MQVLRKPSHCANHLTAQTIQLHTYLSTGCQGTLPPCPIFPRCVPQGCTCAATLLLHRCVRLHPEFVALLRRMQRIYFLNEGQDMQRWV